MSQLGQVHEVRCAGHSVIHYERQPKAASHYWPVAGEPILASPPKQKLLQPSLRIVAAPGADIRFAVPEPPLSTLVGNSGRPLAGILIPRRDSSWPTSAR